MYCGGDDLAGTVVEVGGGVTNFKPGDRVLGVAAREGLQRVRHTQGIRDGSHHRRCQVFSGSRSRTRHPHRRLRTLLKKPPPTPYVCSSHIVIHISIYGL
ncbi:hypothetical protein V1525DRAFT_414152, partial [Lipomyces kononenkoae]